LAALLLTTYKRQITGLTLTPADKGCFEVSYDGQLVFSKLEKKEFPDQQKLCDDLGTLLERQAEVCQKQAPQLGAAGPPR